MPELRRTGTCLCLILVWPGVPRAEIATAQWDTYFYAAPRANAPVLDEVERGTTLDATSCEAGWCRVRYGEADGYVRESILHGPANAVRQDNRSLDACFSAAQPGGNAWQEERFCHARP